MTLSWVALVICIFMAVFNFSLALVNTARDETRIAFVNTCCGLLCMGLAAINVPFITGAWT